jgi:hypothetical protein
MEDKILNPMHSSGDPGQGRSRGHAGPLAKCHHLVKALLSLERLRIVASTCFQLRAARLAVNETPTMDGSKSWMGSEMGAGRSHQHRCLPHRPRGCRRLSVYGMTTMTLGEGGALR